MDRLDTMRAFVAVAEEEGFAPAARRLSMSPPAVTRAIAALEQRVGTRLLQRSTRVVRLTEAGTRYLADCKRILNEIDEAEASAAGLHGEPKGQLAVTASVLFGRLFVAPIILDFLARHPGVTVRALLLDRVVDLLDEGIDAAVRIAHLPDSALTAIRVGYVRRVVCASPDYLKAHGTPQTPADLSHLDVITFSQDAAQPTWIFGSEPNAVRVTPRSQLAVNSADVCIAAALSGRGLTRVLSYMVGPEVQAGRLAVVLKDFEPPPIPVHVVFPEGRRAAAKVRAFVDFAVERLRANVWLS
jgi:DNA-binding transcriptional LysR family regulator